MKNTTVKNLLLAGIITLAACNSKKEEPSVSTEKQEVTAKEQVVDKEQIKREIQAKENEFAETYNAGILKDIGYYADDATSYYQNRAPLVGKKAIVEFLKSDLSYNTSKISFTTNEVFVSNDGNQVVEIGYFKVVDSTNKPINTGHYMSLFEKRNGRYVTVRDMSASDGTTIR